MKVYQSCGKLEIEEETNVKKITVKTHLPNLLKGGKYEYQKYYNISKGDLFAIVGVLVVKGEKNVNMRTYPSTSSLKAVDANPIHLPHDLLPFGDDVFGNLEIGHEISFICYHDDEFDKNNAGNLVLKRLQADLPNFSDEVNLKSFSEEKGAGFEPKKGNGGILTVDGCS